MSIYGNVIGSGSPRADWNQADPARADYIKNKPTNLLTTGGGTMTGGLNMAGNAVEGLPDPTEETNPATKGYVDGIMWTDQVVLTAEDWAENAQTLEVDGVTADNPVVVSPAEASFDAYVEAGVRCSGQAAGSLTFLCKDIPTAALTVNLMIWRGTA